MFLKKNTRKALTQWQWTIFIHEFLLVFTVLCVVIQLDSEVRDTFNKLDKTQKKEKKSNRKDLCVVFKSI